ncbi:MAG: hypothetical protein PF638_02470 [Candidatus Delongbacteria bacterium]|nr:hypothetical protein [Candidatus Delongbacteria bacterium]
MRNVVLVLILIGIALVYSQEQSNTKEEKRAMSYQSMVKDSLGNPIEDGKYLITFRLYESENSSESIWFENQNVYIYDGILNVLLGNKKRLSPEMFRNQLWITLEMSGEESDKQYVSASSYSMYSGLVDINAFAPSEDVHLSIDPDGRIIIDVDDQNDIPSIYGDDWNFYTGGDNNWVLHTPDDDRQNMYIKNAADVYSGDWTRQTVFYENGDLEVNGNIIGRKDINLTGVLNATAVNSKINASYFGLANTAYEYFDFMSFTDKYNNAVGSMMYNRTAPYYGGNVESDGTYDDFVIYARNGRDLVLKSDIPNGDVFIGAETCSNNLTVTGGLTVQGTSSITNRNFNTGGRNSWIFHTPDDEIDGVERQDLYIINSKHLIPSVPAKDWSFQTIFHENGDLGVNGDLRVRGKIEATEIEVKLVVYADYVFKDDYNLLSLTEVEDHINSYGYLPGMPSEKEVVENGLNLNEMHLKVVEKIEELTLHMIRLEKENKELKERLNQMSE